MAVDDSIMAAPLRDEYAGKIEQLVRAGRFLDSKGWVPATSSNFSMRLTDGSFMVTVSGFHKGELSEEALMRVDAQGQAYDPSRRPSAETLLHAEFYRRYPDMGVVLHTHSVNATVLSRLHQKQVVFEDYELLKAFSGIDTHETRMVLPVFPNDQDIPRLAARVDEYLGSHEHVYGYLISGHGLYTWGRDMQDALRHIEAFEFLFECELTMRRVERQ